ncbi:MAG: alpha-glucan phosphorylase, partial [Acidobacteriota bacterium]|nr:alpha-glucan phosphorylase [Acidobacteriota bacterium]
NGGLNLSVLDGWWPEGFDGTNGWAIGPELHEGESHEEDADDAESFYHTLETEVVPTYYSHDGTDPVPHRWVAMMKRAIITLAPAFNSDRMVQEYTRKIYVGE